MRIFLFLILSMLVWGCSSVEVTKEAIKVKNTIADKVKKPISPKENKNNFVLNEIIDEKTIEDEIEIIQEKQDEEKSIIESQQKLAEINFIGKTEIKIINLFGKTQLARIDGPVYMLRYDSNSCRLFLFFNQESKNKRVEYFELRNTKAKLLNSKQSLEQCYREFELIN